MISSKHIFLSDISSRYILSQGEFIASVYGNIENWQMMVDNSLFTEELEILHWFHKNQFLAPS